MAKGGKKSKKGAAIVTSDALPILDLKFGSDPLFAMSAHPSESVVVTGSATGQMKLLRYDAEKLERLVAASSEDKKKAKWPSINIHEKSIDPFEEDKGVLAMGWRTKRHKGSCRALAFDYTGTKIYSAGLDNQLKLTNAETGLVLAKSDPKEIKSKISKILTVPNKKFLIVGTEDGDVLCYDSESLKQIYSVENVHEDSINAINHYVPKSDYQFVTAGSSTVAHLDIRKPEPLTQSEDQEDEILCSTWLDPTNPSTLLCGMSEGVVTIWKPEMNRFNDQISRIRTSKEPIESMISALDNGGEYVFAGSSNGVISKINARLNRVVETRQHSSTDEIALMDLDSEYRLISSGMDKLRIWSKEGEDEEDEDEDDEDSGDSDAFEKNSSDESDSSDEEETQKDAVEEEWTGFSGYDISEGEVSEDEKSDDEESELSDESEESDLPPVSKDLQTKSKESVKRRFASLLEATEEATKKAKTEEPSNSDSDSDGPETVVELQDIKDKLLAQLDSESEGEAETEVIEKKLTKKEKKNRKKDGKLTAKQLKNLQTHEHGIKRFDDL